MFALTPPSQIIDPAYNAVGLTPKANWNIGNILRLDGASGLTGANVVLTLLFFIVGLVFFFNLVVTGWEYMSSTGDPKRIQAATTRFLNNLFGLVLTIFSVIIIRIALNLIGLGSQNYI